MEHKEAFPIPFRRSNYFVRKCPKDWLHDVKTGLAHFDPDDNPVGFSATLNGFSLLLLKVGKIDLSQDICQLQSRYFLQRKPEFSVQPWINLGRINVRLEKFDFAEAQLFTKNEPKDGTIHIAGVEIKLDNPNVLDVCQTVRIVDGIHLILHQFGPEKARQFLESDGLGTNRELALEMLIWITLYDNDTERLEHYSDQLLETSNDFAKQLFYGTLLSAVMLRKDRFVTGLACLLEILRKYKDNKDFCASLLHAIRLLLAFGKEWTNETTQFRRNETVLHAAERLGDIELYTYFEQGLRYTYALTNLETEMLDDCCFLVKKILVH